MTLVLRCSQFRTADRLHEASRTEDDIYQATPTDLSSNGHVNNDNGREVEFAVEEPQPEYLRGMLESLDEMTQYVIREQRQVVQESHLPLTKEDSVHPEGTPGDSSTRRRRRKHSPSLPEIPEPENDDPGSDERTSLAQHESHVQTVSRQIDSSIFSGLFPPEGVRLDIDTYMRNAEHQLKRRTSAPTSQRYQPRDLVCDANARNTLSLIARHFQKLDAVMAELIQSMVPVFPREVVVHLLGGARNSATTAHEIREIEMTYLGDLGHFCEALVNEIDDISLERSSIVFQVRRVNNQWLKYLQNTLELPYWELAVNMLAMVSFNMPSSQTGMLAIYRIAERRKRSVENQLDLLQAQYSEGRVSEKPPLDIMQGIRARLSVLGKIESLLCPVESLPHLQMFPVGNHPLAQPIIGVPRCQDSLERLIRFSIIFVTLALALLPGMVAFGKAAAAGEIGSAGDSDYFVTIRDSIMAVLGVALAAVPLIRRAHRKSGVVLTTMLFPGLSIALAVISVAIYTKVHREYSSLSGFFAQFFAIVSLAMLSMESAGSIEADGTQCADHGKGPGRVVKVKSR